jgi:hypothetical protein
MHSLLRWLHRQQSLVHLGSMKLVFALIVLIDGTVDAEATSYWHDITRCRWFAEELTIQGTIRRYDTPVHAYCKPMYVDPAEVVIYD